MLPDEKVADALFKWEKYARSTNSTKILKLTFKVTTPVALSFVIIEFLYLETPF